MSAPEKEGLVIEANDEVVYEIVAEQRMIPVSEVDAMLGSVERAFRRMAFLGERPGRSEVYAAGYTDASGDALGWIESMREMLRERS